MTPAEFNQKLEQAGAYLRNDPLTGAVEKVADRIQEGFEQNIHRAEGPDGTPWPPRKDTKTHPLLILTGALLEAAGGGDGAIREINDRDVVTGIRGTSIPYAAAQNYGYPPNNLPAREYVYASEDTLADCEDAIAEQVEGDLFGF